MSEVEKSISNMCDLVVSLIDENARLRAALTKIACYDDGPGNRCLKVTGRYQGFDEPWSVEIARAALEDKT